MNTSSRERQLREKAAEWFARLNARTVTVTDLEDFRTWRSDPEHRRAYEQIESVWRDAGTLGGDPDIQRALADAGSPLRRRGPERRLWFAAAACCVLALGAVWFIDRPRTYTTEVGERRVVRLADGSRIHLDTATAVRVKLGQAHRDLELVQGQALFHVAGDADRPFRVVAADTAVIATGTRFDVRRDGDHVRVTLVEGGVTVSQNDDPSQGLKLSPGQQVQTTRGEPLPVGPVVVDVEDATSWTRGRLTFDAVPLGSALQEINRYGARPLVLSGDVDPDLVVSGVFDAGDSLAFAEAVARLHGLAVRPEADAIWVSDASKNNSSPPG